MCCRYKKGKEIEKSVTGIKKVMVISFKQTLSSCYVFLVAKMRTRVCFWRIQLMAILNASEWPSMPDSFLIFEVWISIPSRTMLRFFPEILFLFTSKHHCWLAWACTKNLLQFNKNETFGCETRHRKYKINDNADVLAPRFACIPIALVWSNCPMILHFICIHRRNLSLSSIRCSFISSAFFSL